MASDLFDKSYYKISELLDTATLVPTGGEIQGRTLLDMLDFKKERQRILMQILGTRKVEYSTEWILARQALIKGALGEKIPTLLPYFDKLIVYQDRATQRQLSSDEKAEIDTIISEAIESNESDFVLL